MMVVEMTEALVIIGLLLVAKGAYSIQTNDLLSFVADQNSEQCTLILLDVFLKPALDIKQEVIQIDSNFKSHLRSNMRTNCAVMVIGSKTKYEIISTLLPIPITDIHKVYDISGRLSSIPDFMHSVDFSILNNFKGKILEHKLSKL